jgi:Ran GTPase-activating protein (RanGAP) involved in mRNA processing and transport
LRDNNIGKEGAKYITDVLKENKTLTDLYLWNNNIGEEGAKYIFEALKENKTLTLLHLGCNSIGEEGAKYITESLKINTTLTNLDLGLNGIGKERDEINKLIYMNNKYKYMKGKHNLLQEEIIEISLVPPDENNIPVLRNGGILYRELLEKYN